jgi:hypothetical protein
MPAAVGGAPTVEGDLAYVPCVDGKLYALYARSGAPRRHVEYKVESALTAPPLVGDDIVATGTADGLVYVFDARSGEPEWIYRCRAPDQAIEGAAEFGIYAGLMAAGGRLFVLAGSGDLYCFSAAAPDLIGPRVTVLEPEPGSATAGGRYVQPRFTVIDDGSGVDPRTMTATLDGRSEEVEFDPVTGVGTLRASVLEDGSHIVKVKAQDYRGNEGEGEWSFVLDVSLAPEEEERPWGATGTTQRRGGRAARRGR